MLLDPSAAIPDPSPGSRVDFSEAAPGVSAHGVLGSAAFTDGTVKIGLQPDGGPVNALILPLIMSMGADPEAFADAVNAGDAAVTLEGDRLHPSVKVTTSAGDGHADLPGPDVSNYITDIRNATNTLAEGGSLAGLVELERVVALYRADLFPAP